MLGIALNLCFFCNSRLLLDGMGVFFPFLTFLLCTISLQGGEDPEISWFASIPSSLPFIPFKRLFFFASGQGYLAFKCFIFFVFVALHSCQRRDPAYGIVLACVQHHPSSFSFTCESILLFSFFFYFTEAFSSVDRGTGLRSPLVWRCDQCE